MRAGGVDNMTERRSGRCARRIGVWGLFAATVLGFVVSGQAVSAQTPDPETLRRVLEQRQQLEGQTERRQSPVDAARERRERRDLPAQQRLDEEPEPLSQIEAEYNSRLGRRLKTEAEQEEERRLAVEAARQRVREPWRSDAFADQVRRAPDRADESVGQGVVEALRVK